MFNRADAVTAPTPFAARLAEGKGVRGPVLPISCGMDLSRFNPGNDGGAFRRRHGIPERPTYTYVGRLDAEKHVDELIRALPLVRRFVDAQFVVVGEGHERAGLERLAEEKGVGEHVIFAGFVALASRLAEILSDPNKRAERPPRDSLANLVYRPRDVDTRGVR